jgi:DNA-directed RNA polymerase alpha subunit
MVFSVRVYNCLKRAKVDYAGDLLYMTKDDFNRVRNLGEKGRLEVVQKLEEISKVIEK